MWETKTKSTRIEYVYYTNKNYGMHNLRRNLRGKSYHTRTLGV